MTHFRPPSALGIPLALCLVGLAGAPSPAAPQAPAPAASRATTDLEEPPGETGSEGADEPELSRFSEDLEVVERQADRTETLTVLDRESLLRRHAPVAFDALDKTPGLLLRSRLGMTGAGLTRLAVRGLGASGPAGLLVLVDGRPDATISFAHPTPTAHQVAAIERIELIHGPSPVLHGSGKTGVLLLTTGRPRPGSHGWVQLSAGSHETSENLFRASWAGGRSYLRVDGSYRTTDGHNPESDARAAGANLRLGWDLSERWSLTATAGRNEDHLSVFGPFFVPGPFGNPGTEDLDLTQTVGDLTLRGELSRWSTSFKLWYDELDPESQVLRLGVERADVRETGARLKAVRGLSDRGSMTLGVDLLEGRAENTPGVPPGRPRQDESITEVGPYVFVDYRLLPRFGVRGGVRLVDHSEYGTEPVAEIGALWFLGEGGDDEASSLRLRATRGYQSPTLQQLYGVFRGGRAGLANPELEPEIVEQYEAGWYRRSARWEVDGVLFLQEGSNLIQVSGPSLVNSGEFSHPGAELSVAWLPRAALRLHVGLTYLDLEPQILGIPDSTVDVGAIYRPPAAADRDLTLSLLGRWADSARDRLTAAAPLVTLDDHFVADLVIRGRAWRELYGFVQVDNLFDERYETIATIPMPGRGVFVGASFAY